MQIYPRSSNLIHFWEFIHEPAIPLIIHTTSPSRPALPYLAVLLYFAILSPILLSLHYLSILLSLPMVSYHILPHLSIPQHGSPSFVHPRSRLCHLTPYDMEYSQNIFNFTNSILSNIFVDHFILHTFPLPPSSFPVSAGLQTAGQARMGKGQGPTDLARWNEARRRLTFTAHCGGP